MNPASRSLRSWLIRVLPFTAVAVVGACSGEDAQVVRPTDLPSDAGGASGASSSGGSEGGEQPTAGDDGGSGLGGRGSVGVGGGSSASGGSSTAGAGGKSCGTTELEAEPPIANVLLVIDKSSSMENEGGFTETKWVTLTSALENVVEATQDRVAYGLDFFPFAEEPGQEPETCETPAGGDPLVPVTEVGEISAVLDALRDHSPAGGTPTAAALTRALEYFSDAAGSELEGDKYVLLATDGGPNCNADLECEAASCTINMEGFDCNGNCCDADKDPSGPTSCLDEEGTLAAVSALAEVGVKTFVVGIPGSHFYSETLDRVAEAGLVANTSGDAKYYEVTAGGDAQGLAEVLMTITERVIKTCRLQLSSEPPALDKINVEIDAEPVPQRGDDGWEIDESTSPPTLVLKGETCRLMETEGAESIHVTFGCPTVIQIF